MSDKQEKAVVKAVVSNDGNNVTKGGRTNTSSPVAYIDLKPTGGKPKDSK